MTLQQTIQLASKEGIRLHIRKGEIVWEGAHNPSVLLLANLKANRAGLLATLKPALDEEDKELLRQAGLRTDDPVASAALKVFGGNVRAVRKAGARDWIHRKAKTSG